MLLLLFLLIIIVVIGLLYVYIKYKLKYWIEKGVPGPKPKWTGSNLPGYRNRMRSLTYDMDDMYREFKTHPFIGFFTLYQPEIMAISPEVIKSVLVKNFQNFHDNQISDLLDKDSDQILGQNLISLTGDEWKEKRADMVHAFSLGRIKGMKPIFQDVANHMISYIKCELENGENSDGFEARELSSKYTSDIVTSCVFGVEGNSYNEFQEDTIRKMGTKILVPTTKVIIYFVIRMLFPFIKRFWKVPLISAEIELFFVDLTRKAIQHRQKHKINRDDILEHLIGIRQRRNLTDVEIAGYGVTFFLAGYETSSILMCHLFYQLGRNRIAQQKLYREIEEAILRNGSSDLSYDVVMGLPYLDQIIHETLRLYPPSPFLLKKCTENIELNNSKGESIKIESGTIVRIPLYSIHRDGDFWSEPDKFIPERFDVAHGGVKQYRDQGVFYPFGDGPRICIGMRFAMAQIKFGVIELIRNFELSINRKTKQPIVLDSTSIFTVAEGGIWIDFKSRSH